MFKVERIEYLTAEAMNKHLEVINECYVIVKGPKIDNKPIGLRAFIEDKLVEFRLTYKKGSKVTTYVVRKDMSIKKQETTGLKAYAIGQRYFKTPDMTQICSRSARYSWAMKKFMFSAKPILWKNDKYRRSRILRQPPYQWYRQHLMLLLLRIHLLSCHISKIQL